MALNKMIVNEVENFIRLAVKNINYQAKLENGWSGDELANYQEELIKILLSGIKRCKTDKALCEYAALISKSKEFPLTEALQYWTLLLKI